MKKRSNKNLTILTAILIIFSSISIILPLETVHAGSYSGDDLVEAILVDQSTLVSSYFEDRDNDGHRQGIVLSSLGTMLPTHNSTFALLSTGIAGDVPVTTDALDPGDERGTWFKNKYGNPRDEATLTMTLEVPGFMHYLYYDIQFFTAEYPEYVGSQYNDIATVTVNSPSKGITTYSVDVNGGDFVLNSHDIPGTGFNIFAQSGDPELVDWVDTTPRTPGADAGATALIGREHPVSPYEQIEVTFNIKDIGDSQFDSAIFIDNLRFSGYAKTDIVARKLVQDLNGGFLEGGDIIEYSSTISNIGAANQGNNPGNEFEDAIPANTTYVNNSLSATSGLIEYNEEDNKIIWNGEIPGESSVALKFQVKVENGLANNTMISNQGTVYWDSTEDGINDETELTDNPIIDDGIDQDGDGETNDDDPTIIIVYDLDPPTLLYEDFSDDFPGENATQYYFIYKWFETTGGSLSSSFKVASNYHYSTSRSFETKIRASSGIHYWNYYLSQFLSKFEWWEIWFACGNTSEEADLYMTFKNLFGNVITNLKIEYFQDGFDYPSDYNAKLYFQSSTQWIQLKSDYLGGYLYNGWYKIRIERYGDSYINYSLYEVDKGLVDARSGSAFGPPFSDLACIEWSSTKNPIVCPIFYWDEHMIGLSLT